MNNSHTSPTKVTRGTRSPNTHIKISKVLRTNNQLTLVWLVVRLLNIDSHLPNHKTEFLLRSSILLPSRNGNKVSAV